ncbi:hypothetical protein MMC17_006461 [Xylographa soralifera]|nr:hypothetical protein [Xylographa soralifera]
MFHRNPYKTALRKRWARITINHDDLVASLAPVRFFMEQGSHSLHKQTPDFGQRPSRDNLVNGAGPINLATKALQWGPIPATQITKLVLDFRFEDDAETPEYRCGGEFEGLPDDTLEYSLALLFPHLEKVEAITVDCPVPQRAISVLLAVVDSDKYLLKWNKLPVLKLLESLEIRELAFGEGHGLALATRELPLFKRLLVKTDDRYGTYPSPLLNFFDRTFPTSNCVNDLSKTCVLPKSLKSLVLLDNFYRVKFISNMF